MKFWLPREAARRACGCNGSDTEPLSRQMPSKLPGKIPPLHEYGSAREIRPAFVVLHWLRPAIPVGVTVRLNVMNAKTF